MNKTYSISTFFPKSRKISVNKAIRICVNCGNTAVHIENYGVFCKDCGTFFDVEEKNDE